VLLAGLLLALAGVVPQAEAATRTVNLTNDGPLPKTLTVKPGDHVVFLNDDTVPHQVTSQGGWQYDSGPIPPSQSSAETPALTAPGTYRYSDVRGIVILPTTFAGALVVPKPAPKPSPSPSRTPTSSPTGPPPSPTTTPSASPSATPSATPTPTGGPTPTSTATAHPVPSVTPSTPAPTPDLRYGDPQALVQSSPHRYGLPALLAGVGVGGVLSLLVRVLLALPEGRR
jgi:hypothetical protein